MKPNIVVFLVDDLGVMDTQLRETSFYETPNIIELAQRGMTFVNGYCAHPRCVPSRYAIQTGRFPCHDAMNLTTTEQSMRKHQTIGEAFQKQGYATFFTGKWHLGKEEKDFPHYRGYDVNMGGGHAGAPASYFYPFHVSKRTGKAGKYGPLFGLDHGIEGEHLTDRLTLETEKWIRARVEDEEGSPFFAFISHYAVHTPIEGKAEEVAYFNGKVEEMPKIKGGEFVEADGLTKKRRDNAAYASMIKTMDESVGRILKLLDELKITDDTVILFTSDHGGLSNRGLTSKRGVATSNLPYRAGKGHLYEGGLRVPFIVSYPKVIAAGSRSETVAVGTDLYPTLLDLAGLQLQEKNHADGISLLPALKGQAQEREQALIFHSPLPRPDQTGDVAASAIRVKNMKLVKLYFPLTLELYDLAADPYEKNDLANERPEDALKLKRRLEKKLSRWQSMPPRKQWKDSSVTAPLVSE